MKKLESLKSSKFDSFESKKITSMAKIFGGMIPSAKDANGCADSYSWTPRQLKNSAGQVIGTTNDTDNQVWFRAIATDTTGCGLAGRNLAIGLSLGTSTYSNISFS